MKLTNQTNFKYNKTRHAQLLQSLDTLKKQDKLLGSVSRKELLAYSRMVYSQLNWKLKDQLVKLLNEEFMANKITSFQLCDILEKTLRCNEELFLLNPLQFDRVHKDAMMFTDFLEDLSTFCDTSSELGPNDRNGIKFREKVTLLLQIFLEIE